MSIDGRRLQPPVVNSNLHSRHSFDRQRPKLKDVAQKAMPTPPCVQKCLRTAGTEWHVRSSTKIGLSSAKARRQDAGQMTTPTGHHVLVMTPSAQGQRAPLRQPATSARLLQSFLMGVERPGAPVRACQKYKTKPRDRREGLMGGLTAKSHSSTKGRGGLHSS